MFGRYTTGPLSRLGRIAGHRTVAHSPAPLTPRRLSPRCLAPPPLYSPAVTPIDLRSDTVTKPTPEMRRAMAAAEVGDDVFGEDPTVIDLENRAAELLGKEAGLFVASGAMGNLVSQLAHLARGQETIAGVDAHIARDEQAGHAVVVGTSIRALPESPDGTIDPHAVAEAFRDPSDAHEPITGLVTIENTNAHSMGQPLSAEYTRTIAGVAHDRDVPLHVDGARFWNAVVTLGARPTDLSGPADSVTFCLSKGLSCPVGSVVVGSREFIWRARRGRKLVGGGMRQAGILAAAGLLALRPGSAGMIDRLAEDHANARRLAEGLATMDGILSAGGSAQPGDGPLDPRRVRTNFVIFRVARDRAAFLAALRARGVWMIDYPHGTVRAVTHYGVTAEDIETAIEATAAALAETNRRSLPSEDVAQNADVAGAAVPAGR
jgi:threonine aldolase